MNSGWSAAFRWMGYLATFVMVVMFCNWLSEIIPVCMDAIVNQWQEDLFLVLENFTIPFELEIG